MAAKDGSLPVRKEVEHDAVRRHHVLNKWSRSGTHWRARCSQCAWGNAEVFISPKNSVAKRGVRVRPVFGHSEIVWIVHGTVLDRNCGPPWRT